MVVLKLRSNDRVAQRFGKLCPFLNFFSPNCTAYSVVSVCLGKGLKGGWGWGWEWSRNVSVSLCVHSGLGLVYFRSLSRLSWETADPRHSLIPLAASRDVVCSVRAASPPPPGLVCICCNVWEGEHTQQSASGWNHVPSVPLHCAVTLMLGLPPLQLHEEDLCMLHGHEHDREHLLRQSLYIYIKPRRRRSPCEGHLSVGCRNAFWELFLAKNDVPYQQLTVGVMGFFPPVSFLTVFLLLGLSYINTCTH